MAADRFRILEFWRIAAALAVMAFHFLNYGPPDAVRATEALVNLLPLMDMFFMISGFLIMHHYADRLMMSPGSYSRFLIRRLARLYPLYFVTLLFFGLVAAVVQMGLYETGSPERYTLSALPANLLLMQGWGFTDTLTFNYVGWTLSSEWFCYLTLPVIVVAYRRFGVAGLLALVLASILMLEAAVAGGVIPFETWFHADTWGAYRAFADFGIGALVCVLAGRSRLQLKSHLPAWICFVAAVLVMFKTSGSYAVLLLLAAAMFMAAVAETRNPAGAHYLKRFDKLGQVSFSIYLIHPVIAALVLGGVWRGFLAPAGVINFYVFCLLPIAIVIVLALLSYRYFETPVANWLNTAFDRWVHAPKAGHAIQIPAGSNVYSTGASVK